jgi:glycerol uptake facilitator protein
MSQFMASLVGEFFGTTLLVLLGDGVVANCLLTRTKGQNGGLIAITFGWAMAVFVGVGASAKFSGAHLNPAITIGLAIAGEFKDPSLVPLYIIAQMLGAMLGATLVWLHYHPHWALTDNKDLKLGVFCTSPAVRSPLLNLISEVIGTFVLVFAALYLSIPNIVGPEGKPGGLGAIDALPIGLVVLAIGLSLGGTTGYAINPARDLGPRIMHFLLPIPGGKRDSDWEYSWIPVIGPVLGAVIAAAIYLALGGKYEPPL